MNKLIDELRLLVNEVKQNEDKRMQDLVNYKLDELMSLLKAEAREGRKYCFVDISFFNNNRNIVPALRKEPALEGMRINEFHTVYSTYIEFTWE